MSKEFTGPEFEIEFHALYLEWLKGGKVGIDPKGQWETQTWQLWTSPKGAPDFSAPSYRWKPAPKRTVSIAWWHKTDKVWVTKELVAPEMEAPPKGTVYCCMSLDLHPRCVWDGAEYDTIRMDKGLVFLTREDAQAMADWLAVCRKGAT